MYYMRVCAFVQMSIVSTKPLPCRTGRDQMPSLPETIDTWLYMYNNNNNNNITAESRARTCVCVLCIVTIVISCIMLHVEMYMYTEIRMYNIIKLHVNHDDVCYSRSDPVLFHTHILPPHRFRYNF